MHVVPDMSNMSVFKKGISNGSKVLIPSGGHTPTAPFVSYVSANSSIGSLGVRLASKKAQKNATKNITSDAINNAIPYRKPSSTTGV